MNKTLQADIATNGGGEAPQERKFQAMVSGAPKVDASELQRKWLLTNRDTNVSYHFGVAESNLFNFRLLTHLGLNTDDTTFNHDAVVGYIWDKEFLKTGNVDITNQKFNDGEFVRAQVEEGYKFAATIDSFLTKELGPSKAAGQGAVVGA